ncbi:MAG: hypothetical protein WCD51_06950 [Anaerolineae bacterium]
MATAKLVAPVMALAAWVIAACVGCGEPPPVDMSLLTGEPCEPPCWQGLTPGVSTEHEVLEYAASSYRLADSYRDTSAGRTVIQWQTHCAVTQRVDNFLLIRDDVLTVIMVCLDYEFTLEQLLETYGPPEKFRANWKGGSSIDAEVILFHPALGLTSRLELKPSDGSYELRPQSKVMRVWYFAPTSLDGLFNVAGWVPFPDKREDAEIVLQDWQGYGLIELIP